MAQLRSPASSLPVVPVGGVAIHAITEAQCIDHILGELDAERGGWVVTVNVDHLSCFARAPQYATLCARADLAVADGMPLVWASRLQGTPLPERVAGANLVVSLSRAAAPRGRAIFLLGGSPGTAEAAAAALCRQAPGLRIAGTSCPPPGFERDRRAMARLVRRLGAAAPDVVYVGLGKPKQDQVIARLRAALPRAWFIGVGASFGFVSGAVPRAPERMQRLGLEWAHRLAQEPRRLAARYLVDDLPTAGRLLAGALFRRRPGINRFVKAIEDRTLALLLLLLVSPLLLVLGIGVKLSSPGPVLFRQRRTGWDGKPFTVLKFRTMVVHTEDGDRVSQASRGDPRITRWGAWLRSTSLDELPQLVNVLRGEMSLVGPRPHAMPHNAYYAQRIESYRLRDRVKPGMTGWAQVNGFRGLTDDLTKMKKRVQYDLYYIEHWSLVFDVKILLLTFARGFRHVNAA